MDIYLIAIVTLLLLCTAAGAKGWFNWIWGALTGLAVGCALAAALYVIVASPWFRRTTGLHVPVGRIAAHAGARLEQARERLEDSHGPGIHASAESDAVIASTEADDR